MTTMRFFPGRFFCARLFCAGVLLAAVVVPAPGAAGQAAPERQPVLVELFTSEGCSSCPPADDLLAQLDSRQFVPGAQAIVLSEHVTYWNHEGWRDPFSLDEIDARQNVYVSRFRLTSSYTPEMVVDGAVEMVGNNAQALAAAVARAATAAKPGIAIENAHRDGGAVSFSVHAAPPAKANLVAAVAENATRSEVSRGENRGRTLNHVAVVLGMKEFGTRSIDGRPLRITGIGNAAGPLRLVVFLEDEKTGHVTAVAEQMLSQ
jgi:hypothetical protein